MIIVNQIDFFFHFTGIENGVKKATGCYYYYQSKNKNDTRTYFYVFKKVHG
ncbi:MAG: hypothetical protein HC905_21235 [Bacteroidales bacterium]|nr:hypothetical protein [Bacteroidales bacterium]